MKIKWSIIISIVSTLAYILGVLFLFSQQEKQPEAPPQPQTASGNQGFLAKASGGFTFTTEDQQKWQESNPNFSATKEQYSCKVKTLPAGPNLVATSKNYTLEQLLDGTFIEPKAGLSIDILGYDSLGFFSPERELTLRAVRQADLSKEIKAGHFVNLTLSEETTACINTMFDEPNYQELSLTNGAKRARWAFIHSNCENLKTLQEQIESIWNLKNSDLSDPKAFQYTSLNNCENEALYNAFWVKIK